MKPGTQVTVTDQDSPHKGKIGTVISTASTLEFCVVSVRFEPGTPAVWFERKQLS